MERREALRLSVLCMGYSLSGMAFSTLLNGCKVDSGLDWTPLFFTEAQAITIAEMSEHILPKSDTPGAKDVLVDRFIDKLLAECYVDADKKKFLDEMALFQKDCEKRTGKTFEQCTADERDIICREQEEISYQPAMYLWGNKIKAEGDVSFYHKVKGLVLLGYFSSEEVGKDVLDYNPVPGKFVGCVPLSQIGNLSAL